MCPAGRVRPTRSRLDSASGSTKVERSNSRRSAACRMKVSSSPPQLVESTTSGRSASSRVISAEKSVAPKRGNSSATTRTPGFSASMPVFQISQLSRPQA
jgi:hypothetical protein